MIEDRDAIPDNAYVSMRQHTSAYASIRQHTSAYVGIREHANRPPLRGFDTDTVSGGLFAC